MPRPNKHILPIDIYTEHTHTHIEYTLYLQFIDSSLFHSLTQQWWRPRLATQPGERCTFLVSCHAHWAAHCGENRKLEYTDVSVPHRLTGACTRKTENTQHCWCRCQTDIHQRRDGGDGLSDGGLNDCGGRTCVRISRWNREDRAVVR